MYSVEFKVRHRYPKPENKSGTSWVRVANITIEAETIEEVLDKAYNYPAPDDVDIEAFHFEATVRLGTDVSHRKDMALSVMKEF